MFNMTNESKTAYFSKILMGFGLVSYLVLFLAGAILHNHPVVSLSHVRHIHEQTHSHSNCSDGSHHGKSDKHGANHHNCPVCHFQAVAIGTLLIIPIVLFFISLITFQIFLEPQNYYFLRKYFCIYLRAPPILAV